MEGSKERKEGDAEDLFQHDEEAFFDQLLTDAGCPPPLVPAPSGAAEPGAAGAPSQAPPPAKAILLSPPAAGKVPSDKPHAIESEYAELTKMNDPSQARKATGSSAPGSQAGKAGTNAGPPGPTSFILSDGSDNEGSDTEALPYALQQDLRPPPMPEAPEDFTAEDLALRTVLADFYLRYKTANLSNINLIVKKYAGRPVPHLWAQLVLKYGLEPWEGVELLSKTLYVNSPFEYSQDEQAMLLDEVIGELQQQGDAVSPRPSRVEMLRRAIQRGAKDGYDGALRMLSFRGIPDEPGLRPQCWKVLLGYLPMDRHDEWNAIQGEKRALYASYRAELLKFGENDSIEVYESGHRAVEVQESRDMLQDIMNDVDRTRRDFDFFCRPATRTSMCAMLYVYARLNPGVRYVQGMNEVAAVMLHVMSHDPINAEADSFWCFSELMVEIKESFMQALDNTGEGVAGVVGGVARLVKAYDPELAKHLHKADLPSLVFALRWCTVLFAQDATLPDVVRLWDSFIADPRRYEFVVHVAVAVILGKREELLATNKQFEMSEVLQDAPKTTDFEQLMKRAFAIIAFERRMQTPPFPPKSTLQVVDELSELAQTAAAKAQEVGAEVSRTLQENIAPAAREKAGQVASVAAVVAADGAQAVQTWLEDTAPARKEAISSAQTQLSSLWTAVRATSAIAVSKGQALAAEVGQSEAAGSAASTITGAAGALASSGVFARATEALGSARGHVSGYAASATARANAPGAGGYPGDGAADEEEAVVPPLTTAPDTIPAEPNAGRAEEEAKTQPASA